MENQETRTLVSQLADDFGWLEEHCRQQPELVTQSGHLRLAASLIRNCVGPFVEDRSATPLHVAVVGGAGAGKSTVVNLLNGAGAAEANPQAGFTRHPIAYTSANGELRWPAHLGFLGPLERLTQDTPANLDADVYQVRRVAADPASAALLNEIIVWDCPDMTTWAATGYVSRLLEIAGLADLVVYVASDERYNDEVPTQFLHMLLQTGKPVIVCLMKMQEANAPVLISQFQREILGRWPPNSVAYLAIPFLSPVQLADPVRLASQYRIPLLNQVAVLGSPAGAARQRVVRGALNFLIAGQDRLLSAVRHDVAALEEWQNVVSAGRAEFDDRYRREYLASERFHSFDEALVRLLDLLELPGVGKFVSGTLWVVRTPYRLVKGWFGKALNRPETRGLPELSVLEGALKGWLDFLHKEAMRRADRHPVWAHVEKGFASGMPERARERFRKGANDFQLSLADEVDRTARSIYEELEKNPIILNTLRSGNFALDVAAIVGALTIGHLVIWQDAILVPLLAAVKQQIVELLGRQYVDNQRELIRSRQQQLMAQHLSVPMAEWLAQWPATGGSTFERLQLALRRIPPAVHQLESTLKPML